MKPSVRNYCDYDDVGLIFMFLLSYGPFLLVCLITLILLGTIAIVMCKRALQQEQGLHQPSVHRQGLKEVLPLLLYPLSYFLLWIGEVTVRLYDVYTWQNAPLPSDIDTRHNFGHCNTFCTSCFLAACKRQAVQNEARQAVHNEHHHIFSRPQRVPR